MLAAGQRGPGFDELEAVQIAPERGWYGRRGSDDVAERGTKEAVVEQRLVEGGAQPEWGEVIAVGVRETPDEAVQADPAQLVAHHRLGQCVGWDPEERIEVLA